MKRYSSIFRTTILAITASLCFTQAPLKADGLLYEMGDWLKVHVNAAWNVEDLDSLKGTQKSLLLATTLLGTYLLADRIQSHDTSSRTTKKYCRWTKQAVKISLPIFALLGLYNTANNLGWGPGETLSALGTLLWTIHQMWPSIAGGNQPPAAGVSRQNFPPFDPQFRQNCPTLVPQKLAEVQDNQNPPHTLLCSQSIETMGSALFAETYKARKRTCTFKPIEEAVQYINLADCETPEDRATEIDAAFNRFNYTNLTQRFLYIDSIELLNTNELAKKLTDTLANLLVKDEDDPHRVTVIAHTTKLGLVNPSILRLFDAGHRIELRASLAAEKSFVPTTDQEINAFISTVWSSATDQQKQALVAAHRGTTIKNLVDGITKAKLQKQIADQDSTTSIDLDSNTEHAKKARERLRDALADESFTTYVHKPKQDQDQKKADAARNEQEEKNLAQTLTELTAEETTLNAQIAGNKPDARWDLRTPEVLTKERQAELAKVRRAKAKVEIKIKALAGAKARFEADKDPAIARAQEQSALGRTLLANSFVQREMQINPKVKTWAEERDAALRRAQTQQDKDRLTEEFNKELQELLHMQQNPRRFIDDMLGSEQISISKDMEDIARSRDHNMNGGAPVAQQPPIDAVEKQCYDAFCHYYGKGVAVNKKRAAELYELAANAGNAKAQCNLGYCYQVGAGVEADAKKAVAFYQLAADQGFALGQYNLAICYMSGTGITKNIDQAIKYLDPAAQQGFVPAKKALLMINRTRNRNAMGPVDRGSSAGVSTPSSSSTSSSSSSAFTNNSLASFSSSSSSSSATSQIAQVTASTRQ